MSPLQFSGITKKNVLCASCIEHQHKRRPIFICEATRLTLKVCCQLASSQTTASALALKAGGKESLFVSVWQFETTCNLTDGSQLSNRATCNYFKSWFFWRLLRAPIKTNVLRQSDAITLRTNQQRGQIANWLRERLVNHSTVKKTSVLNSRRTMLVSRFERCVFGHFSYKQHFSSLLFWGLWSQLAAVDAKNNPTSS